MRVVIYTTTIMCHAIGYGKIAGMQHHVVSDNLVKYFLTDYYARSLVFYNHHGIAGSVEYHSIATAARIVEFKPYLICHKRSRKLLLFYHVVDKVLPYPLLRCKDYVLVA